jgi:hypothetical protein
MSDDAKLCEGCGPQHSPGACRERATCDECHEWLDTCYCRGRVIHIAATILPHLAAAAGFSDPGDKAVKLAFDYAEEFARLEKQYQKTGDYS